MPYYSYKCSFCGWAGDILHSMLDSGIHKCRQPDFECSGVLERIYTSQTIPQLHASAIPTRVRRQNDNDTEN